MKLIHAKLFDYKSIINTEIHFQPDITCLVGITGAGKTSVLELLEKIDDVHGFQQYDLPEKSETRRKFQSNELSAEDIIQIEAKFAIEEIDKPYMPVSFEKVEYVILKRYFDGHWDMDFIQTGEQSITYPSVDFSTEYDSISNSLSAITPILDAAQARIPDIANHRKRFEKDKIVFLTNAKNDLDVIEQTFETFKSVTYAIPHDGPLKQELDKYLTEIDVLVKTIVEKSHDNPIEEIFDTIPKPEYIPHLSELTDKIPLDDYLNNPNLNDTFKAIGRICGFNKALLNNIRNSETSTKRNFFEDASSTLTTEFRKFWTQIPYELIIELDNTDLTLSIKDSITNRTTKATQRSEGLKWVLSLFFKIKILVASKGFSHILLFDSPATAVHDAGKDEIRRFLTKMAEENHLQIIYTTHEKALIDPWRLDRIRFVKKEEEKGTTVCNVKSNGIDSTRIEISKHIGSPAKYSLFGAPVIIHFEGPSDYRFIAALNEFAINNNKKFLHPDIFSIDEMGGIDNSKNIMKICKDLGLEFCLVVDGGAKSKDLQRELGDEFEKYFIQLTDVVGKDAVDIEDLIDPELYHGLFSLAYGDLEIPPLNTIMEDGRKTVNCYSKWLKDNNHGSLNKVGISIFLMNIIKSPDTTNDPALIRTMVNYEKLVDLILKKTKTDSS